MQPPDAIPHVVMQPHAAHRPHLLESTVTTTATTPSFTLILYYILYYTILVVLLAGGILTSDVNKDWTYKDFSYSNLLQVAAKPTIAIKQQQ